MSHARYSIVVPVHNEEAALPHLHCRLSSLLERLDGEAEVVLVDDGSRDRSYAMMRSIHRMDARFKVVHLSRNFGHQVAITAGMDLAEGDAVVVMDADLQDPPEVVLEMARRWHEGYDVVYGVRQDRASDNWFKRTSASVFYRLLRRLTDVDIPRDVGDFRLVDRRALDAFKEMEEGSRFVRGMFSWMGFRQIGVPYARAARHAGETKYPLRKMLYLAVDGVVGFSRVPLRLALNAGLALAALAVFGGMGALLLRVLGVFVVPGWASLVFLVCFLGGAQLAVLGVLGEYIGRTYEEVIRRPLYIVDALHGVVETGPPRRRAVVAAPQGALPDLVEEMA
jgi:glycosyltransferase involved in cell wall biosynthesis